MHYFSIKFFAFVFYFNIKRLVLIELIFSLSSYKISKSNIENENENNYN